MPKPPTCVSCKHHYTTFFGRHWCRGHVSHDNVTGKDFVIEDPCWSMRSATATYSYGGRGASALCGPEGRLWEQSPHIAMMDHHIKKRQREDAEAYHQGTAD